MGLHITVPKETHKHERRVAVSPETVKKLSAMDCVVSVESGAGLASDFTDDAYKDAGAKIVKDAAASLKTADVVLKVQAPNAAELGAMKKGALLVAMLGPFGNPSVLKDCAKAGVDAFSMEFVPRISRAQAMDVLSSQSNLAGYKSVLDAAEHYAHAFPMMMTAAGTVPPAKVFVMGAGVAGLQAIATAKRLGAVVSATDVRPAAKEQVASLGGSFVAVEDEEFKQAETAGGYAKEMSADYKKKQADLVASHIAKQDIVITTALIPGRPSPKLISEAMVKSMKPGSVIVDMAVETGGNCELSKAGEIVEVHGVKIIGHLNIPSRLAADASALYAKNLFNLLGLVIDKEKKALSIDWDDDIIKGVAMTRDGAVVHPAFTGEKKETAVPKAEKAEKVPKTEKVEAKKDKAPEAEKDAAPKKVPVKKKAAKKPAKEKTETKTKKGA
ncbi:MAG: Re/Si-specific NAD(P)(+) transhydrogenase subunit alpha [Alphaproteobacteria bacterium]|nr:Re/Si-specific NAD(P)(+) transhydrogenase subunit alpha [Alphaproteobacteria bacterium]